MAAARLSAETIRSLLSSALPLLDSAAVRLLRSQTVLCSAHRPHPALTSEKP